MIAIAGFGLYIEKKSSLPSIEIFKKAMNNATKMANISKDEINGVVVTAVPGTLETSDTGIFLTNKISLKLGLSRLKYEDYVYTGGSSIVVATHRAMKAIEAGLADTILVIGGGKGNLLKRTRESIRGSLFENPIIKTYLEEGTLYYETTIPTLEAYPISEYALIATRYMYEYNVTDDGRAMIAVRERDNALRNPNALYKDKITLKNVLESPVVSYPLRLLECTKPIDGALAIIVSKHAQRSLISPINILGFAEVAENRPLVERNSFLETPIRYSSKHALVNSGISLDKIEYYGLYDAFTIMVLLEIEELGLSENGRGGEFIEEYSFSPESTYPINTNGGSLNMGQPGFTSSLIVLHEALLQLAELAEGRQVKGLKRALVNTIGGVFDHSATMILGV